MSILNNPQRRPSCRCRPQHSAAAHKKNGRKTNSQWFDLIAVISMLPSNPPLLVCPFHDYTYADHNIRYLQGVYWFALEMNLTVDTATQKRKTKKITPSPSHFPLDEGITCLCTTYMQTCICFVDVWSLLMPVEIEEVEMCDDGTSAEICARTLVRI